MRILHPSLVVLSIALAFYILLAPRFDLGTFGDDARDVLAARSLLQGRYVQLSIPGNPPANFPLPGFPTLLAPFVLILAPAWSLLKIVPIASMVAAAFLFYRIARSYVSPRASLVLLVLFAFNPTTLALSGRVIADSFFLFLLLASFYLLDRFLARYKTRDLLLAAALTGWASITRPEGGLVIVAFVVALARERRGRLLLAFLVLAGSAPFLVCVRNGMVTGTLTGYSHLWKDTLPFLADSTHFLKHAAQVVKTLFIDVVLGVAVETRSSPMTFGTVVCVVMLMALLALRGFHRTLLNRPQTSWALTVGVFFGSYMLLHATWLALDPHYLWPLMPFVLLFIATGIPGTVKSPWVRRGVFVLLLTACFLYVREAAYAVRQSARRPQINRAPHQTLQWIRHQLTGEAFILAPSAPMISLYTGRHATALVPASDAEEYRYRLLQSSITHVFVQPWPMLHVDAAARRNPHWVWGQTPRWISFSPRGFEKIFSQEAENTELFALRPGGKFREAYTFYLQGMSAVEQGKTDAAFEAFLTASRTDPTMVSALNAYGATSLMTGHHLENGKTQLSRAVRLQPGSAIAWLNLARIHRRLGHSDQARFAYARAREILMKQGEPQALLSAVLSEQNTL